jgi:hypothetical protein
MNLKNIIKIEIRKSFQDHIICYKMHIMELKLKTCLLVIADQVDQFDLGFFFFVENIVNPDGILEPKKKQISRSETNFLMTYEIVENRVTQNCRK